MRETIVLADQQTLPDYRACPQWLQVGSIVVHLVVLDLFLFLVQHTEWIWSSTMGHEPE